MSSRVGAAPSIVLEGSVPLATSSPPCPPDEGSVSCKTLMLFMGLAVHMPFWRLATWNTSRSGTNTSGRGINTSGHGTTSGCDTIKWVWHNQVGVTQPSGCDTTKWVWHYQVGVTQTSGCDTNINWYTYLCEYCNNMHISTYVHMYVYYKQAHE